MYSQMVQFTLACKGYDNHHCHNKPPDRKWGWSVDDIMPGIDGPENLRILKSVSWDLRFDIGPWWRQTVEFLPLRHWVEFSTVAVAVKFFESLLTEILNITRCTVDWDGVSTVKIVSLLVSLWAEIKKLIKRSYLKRQSPPVFCICKCVCICVFVSVLVLLLRTSPNYSTLDHISVCKKWARHRDEYLQKSQRCSEIMIVIVHVL